MSGALEPPPLRRSHRFLQELGLPPFRERLPWLGADLQTLRDTFHPPRLPVDRGLPLELPVGPLPCRMPAAGATAPAAAADTAPAGVPDDRLLALLDHPSGGRPPRALVLLLHGLGGSSDREGLRRLGLALQAAGFAVLRLNLRGAGPGRHLAPGTYAARCSSDLLPVIAQARGLAQELGRAAAAGPLGGRPLPLLGAGISLGGTMLLNACLDGAEGTAAGGAAGGAAVFDGLVCVSSPLDLGACSRCIERPRNRLYQNWLLQRLCHQTLEDPVGVSPQEREQLEGTGRCRTIRSFDAAITAPRWGFASVEHYYAAASPLPRLLEGAPALPPTLLVHALDDPWVPVEAARRVAALQQPGLPVVLTARGGHNGFHGWGDPRRDPVAASWGDQVAVGWLLRLLQMGPEATDSARA